MYLYQMVGSGAVDKENRLQKTPRLLLKRVKSDRGGNSKEPQLDQKTDQQDEWQVRFHKYQEGGGE
jgi:hypothetical protein